MKNGRFIAFVFLLIAFVSCSESRKNRGGAEVKVSEKTDNIATFELVSLDGKSSLLIGERELGRATRGEKLEDRFVLENKLSEPIVITNITTNCGCIQLSYGKKPLKASGKMVVNYTYNTAGENGQQLSEVVIHTTEGKYTVFIDLFVK